MPRRIVQRESFTIYSNPFRTIVRNNMQLVIQIQRMPHIKGKAESFSFLENFFVRKFYKLLRTIDNNRHIFQFRFYRLKKDDASDADQSEIKFFQTKDFHPFFPSWYSSSVFTFQMADLSDEFSRMHFTASIAVSML